MRGESHEREHAGEYRVPVQQPTGSDALKSVNSEMANQPDESSGTPRSRLPSATPNSTGNTPLTTANTVSQAVRQRRLSRWLRNSSDTARSISDQSTRKIAK